ncbi:MAG: universal stress protein [Thermodesulfobacteriota bacterium]
MEAIKNILVCLDLTPIDPSLIQYAAFTARLFSAEKVYFLHVIQAYDLPDKRNRSFPDVEASLDQMIREELNRQIEHHFKNKYENEIVVKVEEEDAAEAIVNCVAEHEIDVTLIGQKFGEDRQGRYGHKVAANAACDIIFVPENTETVAAKVLCAIDFSPNAHAAFERALFMAENQGSQLIGYYIQDISRAYFPSSTQRSSRRTKSQAEKKHQELLDKYNIDKEKFPCHIETGEELTSEAEKIYNTAESEDADLIIVGAAGDTATVTSLLGNITETLRRMQKLIPVMIVTARGQKSLLDVFKS